MYCLKPIKTKQSEPAPSPFIDVLNMHSDSLDSQIEIKNENLPTLKACSLDFCKRLLHLNLSMNNISIVDGGFECINLRTLILSDNLIKEIKPNML